MKLEA